MSRNYCIQSLKLIYLLIEGKEMTWVNVWACSHYEAIKKNVSCFLTMVGLSICISFLVCQESVLVLFALLSISSVNITSISALCDWK